ncbi:MAG: hypothetical protein ABIA75_14205 [Candidatus Neomarinimicrobiota bacterium]
MRFYLFLIGFISILGQVVILRELTVACYGVELIYILAIGVWLFTTALGAVIGQRNWTPGKSVVLGLLLIFGLLLPLDVALVRSLRLIFSGIPGTYLPIERQLLALVLAILPLGMLLGLLFQWTAKLYIADNKTLAVAYAIESTGGVFGGLAATLLVWAGMQNFDIALLCGMLTMVSLSIRNKYRAIRYAGIVVFCLLLAALWSARGMDRWMTGWNHPNPLEVRDSPYSRITITGQSGQVVVFENDALCYETETTAAEELVHLAAVQRNEIDRVLVLGGGFAGVLREILKHQPQQVDYVELNAVLLELMATWLPEDYRNSIQSETVTIHTMDPGKFLTATGFYDLIIVGMPDPTSGSANRFYTREFFNQCAGHLTPTGTLAFRLSASENIWSPLLTFRNAGIYRALKVAFNDAVILPGTTNILLASNTALARNPDVLGQRFTDRNIPTRLVSPQYINYLYTNDRFADIIAQVNESTAPVNSNERPICYQYSSMIWLMKFFPGMVNWDVSTFLRPTGKDILYYVVFIAGLAGMLVVLRCRPRAGKIMLVFMAGFIGMLLETNLILHYQVKNGVLFQNIGILLAMFMAGLGAGAYLIYAISSRSLTTYGYIRKRIGTGLLIGFVIVSLIFKWLLAINYPAGIITTALLMLFTGLLVAGTFAYASLSGINDQKSLVSPLYASDLIGGCFGSLLGSLIIIPFSGMEFSACLMGILALAAIILI